MRLIELHKIEDLSSVFNGGRVIQPCIFKNKSKECSHQYARYELKNGKKFIICSDHLDEVGSNEVSI